jgi:MFS-type transporter involved in bile tolerance (Atg22 family)
MNIMAILGSIALGAIYEKISSKAMRATIFMLILILTLICFYLMRQVQFTLENRFVLLLVIGFIGFCVMGNYNILATH